GADGGNDDANTEPDNDSAEDDDSDGASGNMTTARVSSSGGGYSPYQPSSTINTNSQAQQAQASTAMARQVVSPNSLRLQSDQARQFLARQKLRNINPRLRVKPKIGNNTPANNSIITAAAQVPIVIASQTAPTVAVAATQATIF